MLSADRQKDVFLAMLAHELRNPLAAIRNAVQLKARTQLDPTTRDAATAILDRQSAHMVRMVDDLLDTSRIARGTINLQRRLTNFGALLRGVVQSTEHQRQAKGQDLKLSLPEEEVWAEIDPARMEQVLGNLLHNASKFTPSGGNIWLSLERWEEAEGQLLLRLRDDGEGMTSKTLKNAFQLFSQGDDFLRNYLFFTCSIGDAPLAAVLWNSGISFGA